MLWTNLTQGVLTDTPERKAGLEKKVFGILSEIADENVKKLYQSEFRERIFTLFRSARAGSGRGGSYGKQGGFKKFGNKGGGWRKEPAATGLLSKTQLGRDTGGGAVRDKLEKLIILTLVHHPEILIRHEEVLAELIFSVPGLYAVRDALLDLVATGDHLETEAVLTHLQQKGVMTAVNRLLAETKNLKSDWFAWPEAALSDALTGFEHVMARFQHFTAAQVAYEQAEAELSADMTEENMARFVAAQQAFQALEEKESEKEGYRLESGRFSFN